jgi:hypothetical protein
MILIFNLELVPEMDHELITTKELVTETVRILFLFFILELFPGPDHDLETCSVIFHL